MVLGIDLGMDLMGKVVMVMLRLRLLWRVWRSDNVGRGRGEDVGRLWREIVARLLMEDGNREMGVLEWLVSAGVRDVVFPGGRRWDEEQVRGHGGFASGLEWLRRNLEVGHVRSGVDGLMERDRARAWALSWRDSGPMELVPRDHSAWAL